MFTTAVLLLVFGVAQAGQIVLWVMMLKLGALWTKIPGVTTGRALLVLVIALFGQAAFWVASLYYGPTAPHAAIALALFATGAVIGLPVVVIRGILKASWSQALGAWLPTLLANLFGVLLALLVVRPFLVEAFFVPTNSMCPTILGRHVTDVCPTCGKPAFGSPPPRDGYPEPPDGHLMICEGFHVHASKSASETSDGDRVLVMKILRPRRWDVIAFHFPGNPTITYVKRLVGLPGEEVFIKDGCVWINGQRVEPPESLRGLEYVTEIPHMPVEMTMWGAPDRPAKLGADEYFVLGDFSQQAADSRLWETGAPAIPATPCHSRI